MKGSVYEVTKAFRTTFCSWKVGDKFYKEPYKAVEGTNNYYPFNNSYPLWDKHIDMENLTKKLFDTDKPKEYYIEKMYTQEYVDNIFKTTK